MHVAVIKKGLYLDNSAYCKLQRWQ